MSRIRIRPVRPRSLAALRRVVCGVANNHYVPILVEQGQRVVRAIKDQRGQPERIDQQNRIVFHVPVEVYFPTKFQRIFAQEPSAGGVVVSGAVV